MKRKKEYRHPSVAKNPPKVEKSVDLDRWKYLTALAIIVLISFIAYLPVFHNSLLAWDDNYYIKDNPLIYSFNLKEIFSNNVMGNWHPLTILALAVEYHLFGLSATGYHAVNLLLHLLNIILVFYTVFLLSDKVAVALVASLLFGIHPMHVESVAWAAELKDLLYTFFFLASYIFYLKYLNDLQNKHHHITTSPHHHIITSSNHQITTSSHLHIFTFSPFYILALLLFVVSLLSKAMAASLPLVLILTDYFKGRKINRKVLLEKAPFFLLAIVIGVVAVIAQKSSGAANPTTLLSLPQRVVFASYGFVTYLVKLLFPLNLSALYPYPVNNEFDIPIQYYAYVLCFLGLAAYVWYSRRFSKKIIFGMEFFTVTVILVLQLLPVGQAIMADRYSYIPSIGIFYLAGEGFLFLWKSKKLKLPAIILLSVSSILFSAKTYARCGIWKNDITLWNDVIDQYKTYNTIADVYYNRGIEFMNGKRNDDAIKDFNKAIELNPDFSKAYNNRGNVFVNEKRNTEAISDFNKAIELKPDNAEAYNNRGNFLGKLPGNEIRNEDAIKDLNKAIELKPKYAEAYNNRGNVFSREKRYDEAIKDFNEAIELKPGRAEAYNDRAILFVYEKRGDDAINDFNRAIELKPDYAEAYFNRGNLFALEKRTDEAIGDFKRAITLKPGYTEAYTNMGNNFFAEKNYEEAINIYTKAIALKPDYAQAYFNRGLAEFYAGKKDAACMDLKQAVSLGYEPAADALAKICK
jgi:tetratricopeptide (TPR) repeat protein